MAVAALGVGDYAVERAATRDFVTRAEWEADTAWQKRERRRADSLLTQTHDRVRILYCREVPVAVREGCQ